MANETKSSKPSSMDKLRASREAQARTIVRDNTTRAQFNDLLSRGLFDDAASIVEMFPNFLDAKAIQTAYKADKQGFRGFLNATKDHLTETTLKGVLEAKIPQQRRFGFINRESTQEEIDVFKQDQEKMSYEMMRAKEEIATPQVESFVQNREDLNTIYMAAQKNLAQEKAAQAQAAPQAQPEPAVPAMETKAQAPSLAEQLRKNPEMALDENLRRDALAQQDPELIAALTDAEGRLVDAGKLTPENAFKTLEELTPQQPEPAPVVNQRVAEQPKIDEAAADMKRSQAERAALQNTPKAGLDPAEALYQETMGQHTEPGVTEPTPMSAAPQTPEVEAVAPEMSGNELTTEERARLLSSEELTVDAKIKDVLAKDPNAWKTALENGNDKLVARMVVVGGEELAQKMAAYYENGQQLPEAVKPQMSQEELQQHQDIAIEKLMAQDEFAERRLLDEGRYDLAQRMVELHPEKADLTFHSAMYRANDAADFKREGEAKVSPKLEALIVNIGKEHPDVVNYYDLDDMKRLGTEGLQGLVAEVEAHKEVQIAARQAEYEAQKGRETAAIAAEMASNPIANEMPDWTEKDVKAALDEGRWAEAERMTEGREDLAEYGLKYGIHGALDAKPLREVNSSPVHKGLEGFIAGVAGKNPDLVDSYDVHDLKHLGTEKLNEVAAKVEAHKEAQRAARQAEYEAQKAQEVQQQPNMAESQGKVTFQQPDPQAYQQTASLSQEAYGGKADFAPANQTYQQNVSLSEGAYGGQSSFAPQAKEEVAPATAEVAQPTMETPVVEAPAVPAAAPVQNTVHIGGTAEEMAGPDVEEVMLPTPANDNKTVQDRAAELNVGQLDAIRNMSAEELDALRNAKLAEAGNEQTPSHGEVSLAMAQENTGPGPDDTTPGGAAMKVEQEGLANAVSNLEQMTPEEVEARLAREMDGTEPTVDDSQRKSVEREM